MRITWPTTGVNVPAALVNVIVHPPPYAVQVKKLAVVQSTTRELVAVATAVPRAEMAIAGPGRATQPLPLADGIKPAGADSSAGVLTVLVAPFRTTELATVFERIMRWSFRSIEGGDENDRCGAGDMNDVDGIVGLSQGLGGPRCPAATTCPWKRSPSWRYRWTPA